MVRIMIVLLGLGCCYLGWLAYTQQQKLDTLRTSLAQGGTVPGVVSSIQAKAVAYTQTQERAATDELTKRGEDVVSFINSVAGHNSVNVGRVDVDPSNEREISRGIVQRSYKIQPNDAKATFMRDNIAHLLYKLELESGRVKVTSIEIKPPSGRVAEGSLPTDLWQFTAEVSLREAAKTRR
jgi:hypothetical protein